MASPALSDSLFQGDSILIMSDNTLYEYSPNGMLISQIPIPSNAENEKARDLTILEDGRLAVFNGTFYPELSVYNGTNWQSFSVDGWSTPNNLSYGGITSIGNTVFVTDGYTGAGGEAKGLIAIDLDGGVSQRFIDTSDYIDITLGEDDLLYALKNTYGDVDVIDPVTLAVMRSIDLGHTSASRGVTANAEGMIYMVSWDGYIGHYNESGALLNTLFIGGNLQDIDVDSTGRIIVGSRFGQAYLTDETISTFSEILATSSNTFVSFVSPITTPEPPILAGTHSKKGRNLQTVLNWSTEAPGVDVYFNGQLIDSILGQRTATYSYFKNMSQVFVVCNIGTKYCSSGYVAN